MTAAARFNPADAARRAMLAKVHIARKELRLQESEYRAMLARLTGHDSAGDCTLAQLAAVLDELKAKGWKPAVFVNRDKQTQAPRPAASRAAADSPVARKARALWISLAQLGAVRNASEQALEAFARRQLKVEAMQWADQGQGFRLIEALKAMAERAGWSQDLTGVPAARHIDVLKERLAAAIAARRTSSEGDANPRGAS